MQLSSFELAQALSTLYTTDGATCKSSAQYNRQPKLVTTDLLISHVEARIPALAVQSVSTRGAKFVGIDVDHGGNGTLAKATDAVRKLGLPMIVSLSGGHDGGFHVDIPFSAPVPLTEAQRLARKIHDSLRSAGVDVCRTIPGGSGNGKTWWKLPCGKHPVTGRIGELIDPRTLQVIPDPLGWLLEYRPLSPDTPVPGERYHESNTSACAVDVPPTVRARVCLARLWKDGLHDSSTRHSAFAAMANAIGRIRGKDAGDKRLLFLDWVGRIYPSAEAAGLANLTFSEAIAEAERLWSIYGRRRFAMSCANPIFMNGMRSACDLDQELRCRTFMNGDNVDFALTVKLGLWATTNARIPGLGKTALAIYLACLGIEGEYEAFTWNGARAFSLPIMQLQELACVSKPTALKWRRRLVEAGLLWNVPTKDVPAQVWTETEWDGRGRVAGFYAIPKLTETIIARALAYARAQRTTKVKPLYLLRQVRGLGMRSVAEVEYQGAILSVRTPYDARFVQSLKESIPWRSRRWNPEARAWEVSKAWEGELLTLLNDYFDEVRKIDCEPKPAAAWVKDDPWALLGLRRGAPVEVAEAAYKALAKKWHPDTFTGNKDLATDRMRAINLAMEKVRKELRCDATAS